MSDIPVSWKKITNIDGRISQDDISPDSCITNLFFTKPGNKKPYHSNQRYYDRSPTR